MTYQPIIPRARIGFIIPTSNRMVEPQASRYLPDDVVPHFTRIGITNKHAAPLDQQVSKIAGAAEALSESRMTAIILQCTGTAMSGGVGMERPLIDAMEAASGVPCSTAAASLTAALRALQARKLVFVSETTQPGHDKKVSYLREAGYEILADRAMALSGSDQFCSMPGAFWFDSVMSIRNDAADAYFISCANIRSIEVIEELEEALGRPVVTSNQVSFWNALRMAGLKDSPSGLGMLLKAH
jgi:maleate isomerase